LFFSKSMAKLQQFPLFPYAAQLVLQLLDLGFNGVVITERPGVQGDIWVADAK
jgi:hypothetical protein